MHTFSHTASTSGASCHNLCQYYLRPSTFERLFPPWIGIKSIHYIKSITNITDTSVSTTFTLPFRLSHPFWQPWKRLSTYDAQSQRFFEELQHPLFVHLEHVRTINLLSHTTQNHIDVTNSITYCLSQYRYLEQSFLFQKIYQKIDRELERIFSYQNRICCHDVQFLPTLAAPYTIVLAGASGFLGKALSIYLQSLGHQVIHLVRRNPQQIHEVMWDPYSNMLPHESLFTHVDFWICLSGSGIDIGRWNSRRKNELIESRIRPLQAMLSIVEKISSKPKAIFAASGIGFYQPKHHEKIGEADKEDTTFLSYIAQSIENTLFSFKKDTKYTSTRYIPLRIAPVLSSHGGFLKKILPLFSYGVAFSWGAKNEDFSWIALDDFLGSITHMMNSESVDGPVNISSPYPIPLRSFLSTLSAVACHPYQKIYIPSLILKSVFGREKAESLLFSSYRVTPTSLLQSGFCFSFPHIETALQHTIGKN